MDATPQQLAEFAGALRTQLEGRSRREIADELGITTSALSMWLSEKVEPTRDKVWALEAALRLKRGALSKLLGYLPLDAKASVTVVDAINADPKLSDLSKKVLLAAYKSAAGG